LRIWGGKRILLGHLELDGTFIWPHFLL
jgi:hypothetical protein